MSKGPLEEAHIHTRSERCIPSCGRARRVARVLLLAALLLATCARCFAQSGNEEYQIKAAFLFHFAQLVEWPVDTAASLLVCTMGQDPFHGVLESTVAGRAIGNRIIRIRHLAERENPQECQILFLDKTQSKHTATLVAGLQNAPVLTVGETDDFLDEGGMISFLLVENKVRFSINLAAADAARLRIGSRLLVLAQNVVGQQPGK